MKLLVLALGFALARPAMAASEIELVTDYRFLDQPVTTEKISELDPDVLNPHRQRWVTKRGIQLRGLQSKRVETAGGKHAFSVFAATLESHVEGYLRPEGPWYRPLREFPCTAQAPATGPGSRFATLEGSRVAVDAAGRAWTELLRKEKLALSLSLAKIRESSPELALRRGLLEYDNWLKQLEADWNTRGREFARTLEWKSYLDASARSGECKARGARPQTPTWAQMMEPLPQAFPTQPLVHAPARRWDGLYSVRLNVAIGAKTLNGQFLIDSSARTSTISPDWLEGQGIREAWVEIPTTRLEKFTSSQESGLARKALVDHVEMSGFRLAEQEFLLVGSDYFSPPEHVGSCCDGILGADFLRNYVVEFLSGPITEVAIWPKEGFRAPAELADAEWIEASLTPRFEIASSCELRSSAGSISGIVWDLGNEESAQAHQPWAALARKKPREGWNLWCSGQSFAHGLDLGVPTNPKLEETKSAEPGVNIGIPVITRGPFFLDLPHGRIWSTRASHEKPVLENRTGLVLEYVEVNGDRQLRVMGITRGSAVAVLRAAKLLPGMALTSVDSKAIEELDLWQIEQRLAGAHGKTVRLEWYPHVLKKDESLPLKPQGLRSVDLPVP